MWSNLFIKLIKPYGRVDRKLYSLVITILLITLYILHTFFSYPLTLSAMPSYLSVGLIYFVYIMIYRRYQDVGYFAAPIAMTLLILLLTFESGFFTNVISMFALLIIVGGVVLPARTQNNPYGEPEIFLEDEELPSLLLLDWINKNSKELEEQTQHSLLTLTELTITSSEALEIPKDFSLLKALKYLRIESCSIPKLSESRLEFEHLTRVELYLVEADALPDSFYELPKLKGLSVFYGSVQISCEKLAECRSLESIEIEQSHFMMCNLLFEHSNLTNLTIKTKKRLEIPSEIVHMKKLEKLSLEAIKGSSSSIEIVPDEIGKLSNLRSLKIINAKMTYLPETICELYKLEVLELEECRLLDRLPDSIGLLKSLQTLNLARTSIEYLPSSFWELKQLKRVDLEGTKISELSDKIIGFSKLEVLNLIKLKITKLPPSFIESEKLTIYSKRLVSKHPNIKQFSPRSSIEYRDIEDQVLLHLKNLEELDD